MKLHLIAIATAAALASGIGAASAVTATNGLERYQQSGNQPEGPRRLHRLGWRHDPERPLA